MNLYIIFFGALTIIGIFLVAFDIFKKKLKNNEIKKQSEEAKINNLPDPTKPVIIDVPKVIDRNKLKLDEFLKKYDPNGNFSFDTIHYRKGATNTCSFNLAEGFKYINDEMIWGYVRIHSGVDRASGGTYEGHKDIVMCPFDFNRSNFIDYGNKSYGTLIQLYQDYYEFEMRIAHMHPKKNILPWMLEQLKQNKPIKQNWIFGNAGTYGASNGNHTHTEIVSTDEESEVLELLLQEQYGDEVLKEYNEDEIYAFYQTQKHFKDKSKRECLENWQQLKKNKQVFFTNKYLYRRIGYDGNPHTWYASNLLFNGL